MKIYDKLIDVLESIVVRPIGLYNKDYRYMVEHLNRNIGNHTLDVSDGYSSPIGTLSNPYYNVQYGKAPWFSYDNDKTRYSNYLDYVRATYGSSTSVENINEQSAFPVDFDSIKIGKISGTILNDALTSKNNVIFNPNGVKNDTKLGKTSAELLKKNIMLAIKENDKHNAYKFSISEPMIEYFGLNTNAQQNGILSKFDNISTEMGRFEEASPLDEEISPVYTSSSKWGNYKDLGIYEHYYNNTPSATTRSYIKQNISKNKYKPNLPDYSSNSNYLDAMKITVGKDTDYKGSQVRYIFSTLHTSDTEYNNEGHTKGSLIGGLKAYGEKEGNFNARYSFKSFNPGINFGKYTTFNVDPIGVEDLLYKTNQGFVNGKYDTLIARFHSDTDYPNDDLMSSSVSKAYGMSHGRNLLRGDAKYGKTFTENGVGDGYDNPYCRVWTYHHQYHQMKDTIRPFTENDRVLTPAEIQKKYGWDKFRTNDTVGMGTGGERLTRYGVIGYKSNAGLVNIAPKKEKGVDIRSCMFSIENLAWKDVLKSDPSALSKEQVGPFGGRIMWFPPYGISFSEQVSANWNSTDFIGRGESIYTYTNTNRSGNLSFQILIDHPAVLDYWKRRNETDQSSNVDDVDAPEQQLLRFFAGCDMLTSKKADKTPKPVPVKDTSEPKPTSTAFTFFVFYPNDYSGEDDSTNNFAIPYLLNGVGTQYYIDSTNGSHRDNPTMFKWTNVSNNQIGGYEVRNSGISIVTKKINNPNNKSFVTTVKRNKNDEYKLAKQIGSYSGRRIEWYYRVDNKRRNEKLVLANDYIDLKSYKLNSGGNQSAIKSTFGIKDKTPLYALTDVYVALTDDSTAKETLKGCYNVNNVATIQQLVDKYGIKEITVKGWASSHGITHNVSRNNVLNKNRRDTVLRWLKTCSKLRNKNITYKALAGGVGPGPTASSVSELKPKLYRCAEVTVYINTSKVSTAQNAVKERVSESNTQKNTSQAKAMMFAKAAPKQTKTSNKYRISNVVVNKSVEVPDKTRVAKFPNTNLHYDKKNTVKALNALTNKVKTDVSSYTQKKNTNAKDTTSTSYYAEAAQKNLKDAGNTNAAATTNTANSSLGLEKPLRYDNEADFFKGLELNDPFMREKITEKIKYFDPAFHSISPEGFNARLTFLHQCTRQGPTIGSSDQQIAGGTTANNLAFGRPPICILRLGDFYYTKIVITSLNISYDPLQWDLNTEGIGVMPMLAKVDMSFNFIGGSNLSGPISRLQNAISFNYYANAEVYDDRAEQVTYDSEGNIDKYKTFPN